MEAFDRLYDIIRTLRSPEGCPWDREQTPSTLRPALVEEMYECIEAIDNNDTEHIKEELGDLFLLITMISYMHEQEGSFTVSGPLQSISDKLIRRHPHVFGESRVEGTAEVLEQWNRIKETIEGREKKNSVLDKVARGLPPLERAYQLQKRASKAGFDWKNQEPVWEKVHEELRELHEAKQQADPLAIEEEFGDLIFSMINLSRFLDIDPALALEKTNRKFYTRFRHVEKTMKEQGLEMSPDKFKIMDQFWEDAKSSK